MKALIVLLCLALPAWAQDLPADAPKATKALDGSVTFNKPAYADLDAELTRLQGIERLHKRESWATVVVISVAVGLVVGAATGVGVKLALDAKK